MNNKTAKILIILSFGIIPIILSIIIGFYGYNRYKEKYFVDHYLVEKENQTEDEFMEKYLKYESYSYETETIFEKDVLTGDGKRYLTLVAKRARVKWQEEKKESNKTIKVNRDEIVTFFYLKNVNEELLNKRDRQEKGEDLSIEKDITPSTIKLLLTYKNNTDFKKELIFKTPHSYGDQNTTYLGMVENTVIPKTDKNGKKFHSPMRVAAFEGNHEKPELTDYLNDTEKKSSDEGVIVSLLLGDKKVDLMKENSGEDVIFTGIAEKLNDKTLKLTKAANRDVKEIGYQKYVIKKYVWWQVLITFVVSTFFSVGFIVSLIRPLDNKNAKRQRN